MKVWSLALVLGVTIVAGCEKKVGEVDTHEAATETTGATAPQHIDTNRAGFRAAGKAARDIEAKGAERNAAADEAMKAGE